MLVLMRKPDQTIEIGPDIVIKILSVEGSRVEVGVEAPRELKIWRGEVPKEERGSKKPQQKDESV